MTVRNLVTLLTSLCNEEGAGECEMIMSVKDTDAKVDSVKKEVMVNGNEFVFLY